MRGRDLLVVAGGLGLAPLRPLIYHAINHRRDFGEVTLLIGARTPQDLIFADEIEKWARRRDLRVVTTVDHASEGWHGHVGVVPALLPRTPIDASRTSALICGPEIMMKFTVRELQRRGLPDPCIWLTMERSMKCAIGFCGHCQWGASFVCRDGPVYSFDEARRMFWTQEI
jgi:NAD(P)H-flavin reductase